MIYKKVIANAATLETTHWTLAAPTERKTPIKFNKQDLTAETAQNALLQFLNKIGFKTDTLPSEIDSQELDKSITDFISKNTKFQLKTIRNNFLHLKAFFQEKNIKFPKLIFEKTEPAQIDDEFEAVTNWMDPLVKNRKTSLPESQLTPLLLPTGQIVYKDRENTLKIRTISETGVITDTDLKLPEGHGIPTQLKNENSQLIIVDEKGSLYASPFDNISAITKLPFKINASESAPLKDLIIHDNTIISLYENGTLFIITSTKNAATGQITNERIRIPMDTNHRITAIKMDPETNTLLFSVLDKDGYSEIKRMDLNPESRDQIEIIASKISGEVHELNPTAENLFFQVESINLGGLVTNYSVYINPLQKHLPQQVISSHSTKILAVRLLDNQYIATGANDIHIVDISSSTPSSLFKSRTFKQSSTKFEDIAGRQKEKGSTLQLLSDGTKITTLRQLTDKSFAVFELTPQS